MHQKIHLAKYEKKYKLCIHAIMCVRAPVLTSWARNSASIFPFDQKLIAKARRLHEIGLCRRKEPTKKIFVQPCSWAFKYDT